MKTIPATAEVEQVGGDQLLQLEGARVGRIFRLLDRTLVGRNPDADVRLLDVQISRRHARIQRREGRRFVIEDLGSTNGTFVNEIPVQSHELRVGDRIRLGTRTVLVFVNRDPLREELLHQRRLEELGRMGIGVAHDLNNMLGAIGSTLDYLDDLPADTGLGSTQVRECLRDLRVAENQAAELTQMLIGFVRGEGANPGEVDLGELTSRVVRMLRHVLDSSITIEHTPANPGLTVLGRQAELMQLVLNLCLNARDAMPGGGTLGVKVERRMPSDVAAPAVPEAAIVISDTGTGMEEETLQHVFDPFFTTKSKAGSLGCGLAIAHAVARGHGGHIDVESRPSRGTVFTARLPLSRGTRIERALKTMRPKPVEDQGLSRIQVLVVDDEPVVRRSLRRLLTRAGCGVVEAGDGLAALDIYSQVSPRPDIVLLDLDMPGMGGLQTAERLAELDPRVRVVFISGHLDRSRDCVPSEARILAKPCNASELLAQVRGAIAADSDFDEETCRLSVAPGARH